MRELFAAFTDRELAPVWILALIVGCCFSFYCCGAVYLLAANEGYLVAATPTLTPFATPFPTNTSYPTSTLTPVAGGVEPAPSEIVPTTAVPTVAPPPTSTPIPIDTVAPPTETPAPTVDSICTCQSADDEGDPLNLDCGDFLTARDKQGCYEYCLGLGLGDVYGLDDDGDGNACEYTP